MGIESLKLDLIVFHAELIESLDFKNEQGYESIANKYI